MSQTTGNILPTPTDAADYTQAGPWDPNTVYTGLGGATGTQKGSNGQPLPADEVEYLGAYWVSSGYTEGQPPQISYQGAYTGWSLDTTGPSPNYYPAVPQAPTGLTQGYTSSNAITLFWNESAVYGEGDVSSYNVYDDGKLIASTTSNSYTATGLAAGKKYVFSVSAVDQSGASGTETIITSSNVNENYYGVANLTATFETPGVATSSSGKYFSPYMDVTLPSTNLQSISEGSKLRDFTLAFMSNDKSEYTTGTDSNGNTTWTLDAGVIPTMSWGGLAGATATPTGALIQQVKNVEAEGGTITVSIGGYTGMDPAIAAAQYAAQLVASGDSSSDARNIAVQNLQSEYQSVLTTYGVHALDFDIENPNSVNDVAANTIRDLAVKGLESANPGLSVSYTVAVTTDGLSKSDTGASSNDYSLIAQAEKDGVTLNTVNIMTMDYGGGSIDMLSAAEKAAAKTEAQLQHFGMTSTELGVTPMIGLNDDTAEVFTLSQAKELAEWASQQSYIAGLGEWEIPRDQQESTAGDPSQGPQPTSSGVVETKPYQFAGELDLVTVASSSSTGQSANLLIQAAASFNPSAGLTSTNAAPSAKIDLAGIIGVSHLLRSV